MCSLLSWATRSPEGNNAVLITQKMYPVEYDKFYYQAYKVAVAGLCENLCCSVVTDTPRGMGQKPHPSKRPSLQLQVHKLLHKFKMVCGEGGNGNTHNLVHEIQDQELEKFGNAR